MQLWSKLFCDSELTHLISGRELHNQQMDGSANAPAPPAVSETPVVVGSHFLNGSDQRCIFAKYLYLKSIFKCFFLDVFPFVF
jgi:hypothetical protein